MKTTTEKMANGKSQLLNLNLKSDKARYIVAIQHSPALR
jgi:hypothetical protein